HYAKAVADLDEHDLSLLAAWHASLEVGHPLPNKEFLVNVFPSLGENRREALKIAAGLRGEEAFEAGVGEEQALDTVLPWLSAARACGRQRTPSRRPGRRSRRPAASSATGATIRGRCWCRSQACSRGCAASACSRSRAGWDRDARSIAPRTHAGRPRARAGRTA